MKKLFGTDGIRGIAGKSPLTLNEAEKLGFSAGHVLRRHFGKSPIRVVIVRDTRESGRGFIKRISDGLRRQGIDVYDVGILCTPAVAFFVRELQFQSGVVISASHNPPDFNGIKFFSHTGNKWPDKWERSVEQYFAHLNGNKKKQILAAPKQSGRLFHAHALAYEYEAFLANTLDAPMDLSSLKIALDCSNGANYLVGPQLLRRFGAKVFAIGNRPNGKNINVGCGSQHLNRLARLVRQKKCHLGIAFDGDGDRVIFVDEKGHAVDGDHVIALLAKHFKAQKKLKNNKAVITVMANLGLKKALAKLGVKTIETTVGDRYVSEAMKAKGSNLGGEQSGHIILGDHLPSGDGLLTALHVLLIVQRSKKPFSKLVGFMKKFPQVLINVRVKERRPISELNGVHKKILKVENILGTNGRVLVRYSGTEPLLRIMIEGPKKEDIVRYAADISEEVKRLIGA